ncbi:MAG TPA: NAD-dependent epimerase/dehydratase family protein, partial [Candidatus Thermoplasmatota archaeon]|nr:NAD-dependent epimerase/dehydratase family protein [Candidatus Thermoplasmatota archaeon]
AAYAGTFGMDVLLFRFANVVGPRAAHGVIPDFIAKLRRDPKVLEVLGDGTQTKSYVSVEDTVAGMLHAARKAPAGCNTYNLGSLDAIPVTRIAETVAAEMGLKPRLRFLGGPGGAGWKGDVKLMTLDVARLMALGWRPQHSSGEAVRRAARSLAANPSRT